MTAGGLGCVGDQCSDWGAKRGPIAAVFDIYPICKRLSHLQIHESGDDWDLLSPTA